MCCGCWTAATIIWYGRSSCAKRRPMSIPRTSYIYEDYGPWREPTESAHYRYSYPDENDRGTAELQVTRTAYPEVSMQQGDNFAAVIIGSRLALLTPSAEGYDLQFVCDTVSYGYEMWKDDPDDTYWYQEDTGWLFTEDVPSDPNSSVYQAYTVATVEERYAMAYNGTSSGGGHLLRQSV